MFNLNFYAMAILKLKVKKAGSKNPISKQLGFTARVLTNGTADFDDIVKDAGRNTTMHKAELRMAFELCMDSVSEMLKQGFIIDLGPLGKIYPSCTSKWYEKEEDMKLDDVKPGLYFRPGDDVEGAIKAAKLVWAKASDEEDEEEGGTTPAPSGGGSGDNNGGGSGSGGGDNGGSDSGDGFTQ